VRSIAWLTAGTLAVAAFTTGCGNRYRPVINPVSPTGPAPEATSYAIAISQPDLAPAASSTNPCPAVVPYANPGVAAIIDFSGDSLLAQASIGNGPLTSAIDSGGANAYALNCDGTITTIPISATLQNNSLATTTLFPAGKNNQASIQSNILVRSTGPYVVNQVRGTVGALTTATSGQISLFQEVAVAPALITLTGSPGFTGTSATSSSQRVYAISQGNSINGTNAKWGDCANPSAVTVTGEADGIESSTNSVSSRLPLGVCPVFGITSLDGLRTFVLNRGSGTISVINTQTNTLDTALNATGTIQLPAAANATSAGPVYASYFAQSQILVTANYDSNTVSFISAPLDVYGNDATGFGQVLATVPVGIHPTAITILGDGSRAYIANQGDGTVSVVSMTSFTVEKTIAVGNHPRAISSTYNNPVGKVYVVAPDSNILTIIRTDTDVISTLFTMQGLGVDVHATTQYSAATGTTSNTPANTIVTSDSSGSGAP